MQAMIKTSLPKRGVAFFLLEQKQQPVYDTLRGGRDFCPRRKEKIDAQVGMPRAFGCTPDRKWTSEALSAIFWMAAIRQIPCAMVEGWEMGVKIDIADTGIGISEQHQGRFSSGFTGKMRHDVDGIGIGLYLARGD